MECTGFQRGMGVGGWLTNYKRFNVLRNEWRGILTAGDFEHFDTYITREDVKRIASFGMDHIRVGFDQLVLEESPYTYRERIFCLLDAFVSWCGDENLHVILNLHKAIGNYCDIREDVSLMGDEGLQDRFIALWRAVERRYQGQAHVAFEILNEVRDVPPGPWNALAGRTIRALRELNPARKIFIGPTHWNSADKLRALRLFDDPNVDYIFHFYDPFEFTHQRGVLQEGNHFYNRAMHYPGDIEPYRDFHRTVHGNGDAYPEYNRMDIAYIRDRIRGAVDFIRENPGKTLCCNEFGVIRHCSPASRENWFRDVITVLKENGIPWCVWNYLSTPYDGNRFSLVDDDTRRILSPRLLEIIQGNA